MPVALAMVMLDKPAVDFTQLNLARPFSRWPELGRATFSPPADKESICTVDFTNGPTVFYAHMPAPIPWGDLEGPCATSVLWPHAKTEVSAHRSHVIVTVAGEDLTPIQLSERLTQATAALLMSCDSAIGVYWGNATLVIPKQIFVEFTLEVLPEGPPLFIWLDFRVGPGDNDSGSSSGFTTGMEALGLMEIEAVNVPETVGDLRDRLFGLASYLIENGPVVKDGDTIGGDMTERIRVIYTTSKFGYESDVMRLHYERESPAKPWWKFW